MHKPSFKELEHNLSQALLRPPPYTTNEPTWLMVVFEELDRQNCTDGLIEALLEHRIIMPGDMPLLDCAATYFNAFRTRKFAYLRWEQYPDLASEFPASELICLPESIPFIRALNVRWCRAGGKLYEGRRIALNSDEVWANYSIYSLPYGPFELENYSNLRSVDIDECDELGILDN